MANYNCVIRTNYFHVKDNKEFEEFMSHVRGGCLELFYNTDNKGNQVYGFGCYDGISGYFSSEEENDDEWDDAYDNFINGLAKHVAEDDAVLMFEVGNEKMRYVVGSVTVITNNGYEYKDIEYIGVNMAKEMLKNPNYSTKCCY